jgi:hypothetical protein
MARLASRAGVAGSPSKAKPASAVPIVPKPTHCSFNNVDEAAEAVDLHRDGVAALQKTRR